MSQEAPHQTLQPTTLVHEAWLRLVGADRQKDFANRAHFFAAGSPPNAVAVNAACRWRKWKFPCPLRMTSSCWR